MFFKRNTKEERTEIRMRKNGKEGRLEGQGQVRTSKDKEDR